MLRQDTSQNIMSLLATSFMCLNTHQGSIGLALILQASKGRTDRLGSNYCDCICSDSISLLEY